MYSQRLEQGALLNGRYSIQVRAADGGFVAATEGFVLSQDLRLMVGFFDQYSLSHHIWAPDGSAMALTGRLAGDSIAASFADPQPDYVLYWEVERNSPLKPVCPGDSAFFRPAGAP